MSWIKNAFLVLFIFIVTIKFGELLLGVFRLESQYSRENRGLDRVINLKEINPHTHVTISLPDGYTTGVDNLERKQYVIKTDENGFIDTDNEMDIPINLKYLAKYWGDRPYFG